MNNLNKQDLEIIESLITKQTYDKYPPPPPTCKAYNLDSEIKKKAKVYFGEDSKQYNKIFNKVSKVKDIEMLQEMLSLHSNDLLTYKIS